MGEDTEVVEAISKKQESADLEKVTDFVEEKELASVNPNNLDAINKIQAKTIKQTHDREELLAKVEIKKEDVDLIVKEYDITKQQAELTLRESNGDIVQALIKLLA